MTAGKTGDGKLRVSSSETERRETLQTSFMTIIAYSVRLECPVLFSTAFARISQARRSGALSGGSGSEPRASDPTVLMRATAAVLFAAYPLCEGCSAAEQPAGGVSLAIGFVRSWPTDSERLAEWSGESPSGVFAPPLRVKRGASRHVCPGRTDCAPEFCVADFRVHFEPWRSACILLSTQRPRDAQLKPRRRFLSCRQQCKVERRWEFSRRRPPWGLFPGRLGAKEVASSAMSCTDPRVFVLLVRAQGGTQRSLAGGLGLFSVRASRWDWVPRGDHFRNRWMSFWRCTSCELAITRRSQQAASN